MRSHVPPLLRGLRHRLSGAALLALLVAATCGHAADPAPGPQPPVEAPAPVLALDLETARSIALEKQPTLAAYRASLAAAEAKVRALDNLCIPAILRPDLPTRRCQARVGLAVAQAQLCQAEWDVTYSVTRMYLTVLYARDQTQVAVDAQDTFNKIEEAIKGLVDKPESNVTKLHYMRFLVARDGVRARQEEARGGVRRALAALREAMGITPECCPEIPIADVGVCPPEVTCEQVLGLALERRGEMAQALGAAQAAWLEVKAQSVARGCVVGTFASGADIHVQPLVQGVRNGDYRPGAIPPEMPVQLVGCRHDRVTQAQALAARMDAFAAKARNLVALEAEDVYHRWGDWKNKIREYETAARTASERADLIRERFNPREVEKPRALLEDVIEAALLATQIKLQYNEAKFRYRVLLADLERVTAGGICPGYGPAATPAPVKQSEAKPPAGP